MESSNGKRFFVESFDEKAHMECNNQSVRTRASLSYFMIANGSDEGKLYVCKGWHHFEMYFPKKKENGRYFENGCKVSVSPHRICGP